MQRPGLLVREGQAAELSRNKTQNEYFKAI
jgi:hypothetical protein